MVNRVKMVSCTYSEASPVDYFYYFVYISDMLSLSNKIGTNFANLCLLT